MTPEQWLQAVAQLPICLKCKSQCGGLCTRPDPVDAHDLHASGVAGAASVLTRSLNASPFIPSACVSPPGLNVTAERGAMVPVPARDVPGKAEVEATLEQMTGGQRRALFRAIKDRGLRRLDADPEDLLSTEGVTELVFQEYISHQN